jgi:hypothetical protein
VSGRKSLTAAPLWAVRDQGRPDMFIQLKYIGRKLKSCLSRFLCHYAYLNPRLTVVFGVKRPVP